MTKRAFVASLAACFVSSSHAGAVVGATEFTQIANMIQLVMSYVEQAQQTVTQLNQYRSMLKNLESMTPSAQLGAAASALWQDQNMNNTFNNVRKIVVGSQNISYGLGNLDSTFRRVHPGYSGYGGNSNFNQLYAGWSDNTMGAIKNSLGMISAHADNFATEEQMLSTLQSRSQSASGQLQALQAGQDISVAMVGQLQKLRQLQMAQMQTQNAYMASEQSTRDSAKSGFFDILKQARPSAVPTTN